MILGVQRPWVRILVLGTVVRTRRRTAADPGTAHEYVVGGAPMHCPTDPRVPGDSGRSRLISPSHNDIMAVAGAAVAAEMGLSVPQDLSLLARDDSQLCRLTHPTLSAMSHDVHGFGAEVARTLFAVIAGEDPVSHPVPTPALTPRGLTAPPPE